MFAEHRYDAACALSSQTCETFALDAPDEGGRVAVKRADALEPRRDISRMAIATLETRIAAQALSALGQAARLGALQVLAAAGPEGVPFRQLAVALGMTHANLSRQLRVLEREGLVERHQDGASIIYVAQAEGLTGLQAILADVGRALAAPAKPSPRARSRAKP